MPYSFASSLAGNLAISAPGNHLLLTRNSVLKLLIPSFIQLLSLEPSLPRSNQPSTAPPQLSGPNDLRVDRPMQSRKFLPPSQQLAIEIEPNCFFRAENYDSRNPVLQFADVPRPLPLLECVQHIRTQPWNRPAKFPGKFPEQVVT